MVLKKDTGKFWSFKDTKNYKRLKTFHDGASVKTFFFDKTFLLEARIWDETCFVIPIRYTQYSLEMGSYTGLINNKLAHFIDSDIVDVVQQI